MPRVRTKLTTPPESDTTVRTELTTMSVPDTTPTGRVTGELARGAGGSRRLAAGPGEVAGMSSLEDTWLGQVEEGLDSVATGSEVEDGRLGWEERPPYGDPAAVSPACLRSRTAAAARATIG